MATLNLPLSENMQAYVDECVASGEFVDAADYVRTLIRADEEHLEWLRDEIQKGMDSGVSPYSGREIVGRALDRARLKCG